MATRTVTATRTNGTKRVFQDCGELSWNGNRCTFEGKEVEGETVGPSKRFHLDFTKFERSTSNG